MIEAPAVPEIAPWQADRYQLWSLLDMLRFYGATFMTALATFSRECGILIGYSEPLSQEMRDSLAESVKGLAQGMGRVPLSKSLKLQVQRLQGDIGRTGVPELTTRELLLLTRE